MIKCFTVEGKVQGVMFRKTFVKACLDRQLIGGATNSSLNRGLVTCTVEGSEGEILKLTDDLKNLKELNSWGAQVEILTFLDTVAATSEHQVNTDNVGEFDWSSGVIFYL